MSFFSYIAKDIRLNADGDLDIVNGDFVVAPSDDTHIRHILQSARGNWRFAPSVGVNLMQYTNSTGILQNFKLKKNITTQLEQDGYSVKDIKIDNEKMQINAQRIK